MDLDVSTLFDRHATNRWERTNLGDILERNTWGRADKTAIVGWAGAFAYPENERLTYRQANDLQNRISNALLARGLQRGDRVLMFCENSVEAFITKFAIGKVGLVGAPLNPNFADDVMDILLERLDPSFVIADAELAPRLLPALERRGMSIDVVIPIGGSAADLDADDFRDWTAAVDTSEPFVRTHGDDIFEILFTSGTTSAPKGAMQSHHSTQHTAMSFATSLSRGLRREHDLVLEIFTPCIYHVAHHIYATPAWTAGGTLVLGRRPDGVQSARAIDRERVTALWGGNPMMLTDTITAAEREGLDLSSLTYAGFGWATITPELYRRYKALAGPEFQFMTHLGQTESVPCLRFYLEEHEEMFLEGAPLKNFVGWPTPLLASRVAAADDATITEPGVPGEVVFRTPGIMAGYYLDEQATAEAFRGGWFHSGDSCVLGDGGVRVMVDRYKDMVKTGGENVSSVRVETALESHAGVLRAAVVGIPHERWGEAVTAVVVPQPGAVLDPDELIAHAKARLGGYEAPKAVIVVEALPETVGGKVLKYKLRAEHAAHYSA